MSFLWQREKSCPEFFGGLQWAGHARGGQISRGQPRAMSVPLYSSEKRQNFKHIFFKITTIPQRGEETPISSSLLLSSRTPLRGETYVYIVGEN